MNQMGKSQNLKVPSFNKAFSCNLSMKLDCEEPDSQQLSCSIDTKDWKLAEAKQGLGYNGHSERTKQWHAQKAHEDEKQDLETRKL
jgi:hypothetical protein